jgi:hypothetical protein
LGEAFLTGNPRFPVRRTFHPSISREWHARHRHQCGLTGILATISCQMTRCGCRFRSQSPSLARGAGSFSHTLFHLATRGLARRRAKRFSVPPSCGSQAQEPNIRNRHK